MSHFSLNFRLSVLGLDEVNHTTTSNVSHIVSLVDPGTVLPYSKLTPGTGRHLILKVHDALDSTNGRRAPTREDALALRRYADALNNEQLTHLLVHCHMGRSRSAAAAAILLVRLGFSPTEAFTRVRAVRDPIWPNWTLIEHGDDVLGCGGELRHRCEVVYRQVQEAHPRWVEDPRPETIGSAATISQAFRQGGFQR